MVSKIKNYSKFNGVILSLLIILCFTGSIKAQEEPDNNDAVSQANNPLANFCWFKYAV